MEKIDVKKVLSLIDDMIDIIDEGIDEELEDEEGLSLDQKLNEFEKIKIF